MDSNIIITAFDRYRHNFGKITLAGLISYGIKVALFYGIAFLWSRLSDLFYAWSPHWTLAIALFFSFGFAQVLAFGFDRMLLHLCQGEKASIKDLFYFFVHRFERALFLSLILTALRAFISVSYTHLDVYKRQIRHRNDAYIFFNRTKGIVGALRPRIGQRVEQRALADVRQTDHSKLHINIASFIRFIRPRSPACE